MKSLTLEQILELHVAVVVETGGSSGLRDLKRLEAVVAGQQQAMFGDDVYKSLYEKAAAMMRGVIADHPFVDSNKRTGMLVGLTFLRVNGCRFMAHKGEIEDFAVKVAVERLEVADIAKWLQKRSSPRNFVILYA